MSALDDLKNKIGKSTELELCILMSGSLENPEQAAAELLTLRSDLEGAKARAETAEENWHKNEARVAKLEEQLKDAQKVAVYFSKLGHGVRPSLGASRLVRAYEAALKGAE